MYGPGRGKVGNRSGIKTDRYVTDRYVYYRYIVWHPKQFYCVQQPDSYTAVCPLCISEYRLLQLYCTYFLLLYGRQLYSCNLYGRVQVLSVTVSRKAEMVSREIWRYRAVEALRDRRSGPSYTVAGRAAVLSTCQIICDIPEAPAQ